MFFCFLLLFFYISYFGGRSNIDNQQSTKNRMWVNISAMFDAWQAGRCKRSPVQIRCKKGKRKNSPFNWGALNYDFGNSIWYHAKKKAHEMQSLDTYTRNQVFSALNFHNVNMYINYLRHATHGEERIKLMTCTQANKICHYLRNKGTIRLIYFSFNIDKSNQ